METRSRKLWRGRQLVRTGGERANPQPVPILPMRNPARLFNCAHFPTGQNLDRQPIEPERSVEAGRHPCRSFPQKRPSPSHSAGPDRIERPQFFRTKLRTLNRLIGTRNRARTLLAPMVSRIRPVFRRVLHSPQSQKGGPQASRRPPTLRPIRPSRR
jgi:hypothetical protein